MKYTSNNNARLVSVAIKWFIGSQFLLFKSRSKLWTEMFKEDFIRRQDTYKKKEERSGMVANVCNASTLEAEAGGSPGWGQGFKTSLANILKLRCY